MAGAEGLSKRVFVVYSWGEGGAADYLCVVTTAEEAIEAVRLRAGGNQNCLAEAQQVITPETPVGHYSMIPSSYYEDIIVEVVEVGKITFERSEWDKQ